MRAWLACRWIMTLQGTTASLQGNIANNAALIFDQTTTGTYSDVITETGAGALNLSVGAVDTNSLRSILGGRWAWYAMKAVDGVIVVPVLRAAWIHEFLDTHNSVNARFNTTGGAGFTVAGADLGSDWALLGTGLKLHVNESLSVFADYDAQVNDRHVSHTGSGGLELQW